MFRLPPKRAAFLFLAVFALAVGALPQGGARANGLVRDMFCVSFDIDNKVAYFTGLFRATLSAPRAEYVDPFNDHVRKSYPGAKVDGCVRHAQWSKDMVTRLHGQVKDRARVDGYKVVDTGWTP